MDTAVNLSAPLLSVGVLILLALIFLGVVLLVVWAMCRLFIKGWPAFFMAASMLFFALFFAVTGVLSVAIMISEPSTWIAPWWVWVLATTLPAIIGSMPIGWLFLRWQKRQAGEATARAF